MKRLPMWLALGGVLATALLVTAAWSTVPAIIPVHFDLKGEANGYGSRAWLWFPVVVSALLFGLLSLVQRAPQRYNLPVAPGQPQRGRYEVLASEMVGWLRVALTWTFFAVAVLEVQKARNPAGPPALWLLPLVLMGSCAPIVWFFWKARALRA